MLTKSSQKYPNYQFYENGDIINTRPNTKLPRIQLFPNSICKIILEIDSVPTELVLNRVLYEVFNNVTLDHYQHIKQVDRDLNNFHYNNLAIIECANSFKNKNIVKLDENKDWRYMKNHYDYLISNYGDVFSLSKNVMLTGFQRNETSSFAYHLINNQGKSSPRDINRLIYDTFVGINNKDYKIVYIDKNVNNNFVDNLQEVRFITGECVQEKLRGRTILQLSQSGKILHHWYSFEDIAAACGYSTDCILSCLTSKKESYAGFIWRYDNYVADISEYKTIVITNDTRTYSKYKINKEGTVINNNQLKMKPEIINNGYAKIAIFDDDGKKKKEYIHRLVMMAFTEQPKGKTVVNHINENKLMDHIDNLEWCTAGENVTHSLGKAVLQYDKNGKFLKEYQSISQSARDNNFCSGSISNVCKGKRKSAHGYLWKFK